MKEKAKVVKTFKEKTQNISEHGEQHGRKQDKRVKEKNETTEKGKDSGKFFRGKKARMRSFNLTKVAMEKERICILKDPKGNTARERHYELSTQNKALLY